MAAIATPLSIVISADAPLPFPVSVVRFVALNVNCDSDGVYPIPGFAISRLLTAFPAVPTRFPVAFVPDWINVFPSA